MSVFTYYCLLLYWPLLYWPLLYWPLLYWSLLEPTLYWPMAWTLQVKVTSLSTGTDMLARLLVKKGSCSPSWPRGLLLSWAARLELDRELPARTSHQPGQLNILTLTLLLPLLLPRPPPSPLPLLPLLPLTPLLPVFLIGPPPSPLPLLSQSLPLPPSPPSPLPTPPCWQGPSPPPWYKAFPPNPSRRINLNIIRAFRQTGKCSFERGILRWLLLPPFLPL